MPPVALAGSGEQKVRCSKACITWWQALRARTWVNLSRFLGSRLRCTSAISLSRHSDRCACRSGGCAATILFLSAVYICGSGGQQRLFSSYRKALFHSPT